MENEILYEWNPWWSKDFNFKGIKREKLNEILPWVKRKEILAIVGVRRAGKTTLLFEIIEKLIQGEANAKNILFIKADDDRIKTEGLIDNAIDEYKKIINPSGKIFIFIDEIQEINEWQKTLKRIYDLTNIKFFISGSNASIINEELSSLLAGRYASFDIFPFSFLEFLKAKDINLKNGLDIINRKNDIRHFLIEYLKFGAFPEAVLEEDDKIKTELIKFYFDSIFYRDIIKRKNIRNIEKLEKLVKYYLQNISNLTNFMKIGKLLELSTDSVGEYTKALENAYLVFAINIMEFSYKKQIINPKKIYSVDLGIRNIVGFKFSEDIGRLYENMVFLHLRRKTSEIFYWKDKYECDFIFKKENKLNAIQVCYNINQNNKEREINGLLDAMEHFKLSQGIIITENLEKEDKINGKIIKYIPLWKWLLKET